MKVFGKICLIVFCAILFFAKVNVLAQYLEPPPDPNQYCKTPDCEYDVYGQWKIEHDLWLLDLDKALKTEPKYSPPCQGPNCEPTEPPGPTDTPAPPGGPTPTPALSDPLPIGSYDADYWSSGCPIYGWTCDASNYAASVPIYIYVDVPSLILLIPTTATTQHPPADPGPNNACNGTAHDFNTSDATVRRALIDHGVDPNISYKYHVLAVDIDSGGNPHSQLSTWLSKYISDTGTCTMSAPTCNISANPASIAYNGTSIISWTSSNTTSCSVSPTSWIGTSGSQNTGSLTSTTIYTARCSGVVGGFTRCDTEVLVGAPPRPTLTCSPSSSAVTWNWTTLAHRRADVDRRRSARRASPRTTPSGCACWNIMPRSHS